MDIGKTPLVQCSEKGNISRFALEAGDAVPWHIACVPLAADSNSNPCHAPARLIRRAARRVAALLDYSRFENR
jgi:hypothetical protein